MKVTYLVPGINVRELKGVGRYATELIKQVKEKVEVSIIRVPRPKRINTLILSPLQVSFSKADVYHATIPDIAPFLVKLKRNTVVTFHDLIPYFAWKSQMFKLRAKIGARVWSESVLKTVALFSKAIIVPSTQTREELITAFNVPEEKIRIIPEGVNNIFKPLNLERKYILFFANFSKRKRVDLAINAYRELLSYMDNPPKLILAGGHTRSVHQQQFNVLKLIEGIEDRVIIKGKISDEEVLKLYNESLLLVFPSDWEGFGLPILEAARCKCVPIVRKEAKIPKEIKECAVVSPTEKLGETIYELLKNEEKRKKIAEELYEKSLKFTWEKTAEETLKVYEEVL